jgi:hypothetical protein
MYRKCNKNMKTESRQCITECAIYVYCNNYLIAANNKNNCKYFVGSKGAASQLLNIHLNMSN